MKKNAFAGHIETANFKDLFNEFGWDFKTLSRKIIAGAQTFELQAVAEKRDFYALRCSPAADGRLPDANTRRSISRQFEKVKNFHLLIFTDKANTEQVWQFSLRMPNRPPKFVETRWQKGQDTELLYQKVRGLFFDLDEEGNLTIVDVMARVQQAAGANAERVTKKFYDGFKREHTAFLGFIRGIKEQVNQEWYASLMLNRLMFCYFIQKKRFLDDNPDYLSDKLAQVREQSGKGNFYSFYRDFLLVLFHQGLNNSGDKPERIGKIPYLNGGLFDVHELEERYPDIQIPDEAFERVFRFFDQYEWHLDNRPGRTGNEINPDVIGYIFEKYINDRADMGAYYTKEDITDYISKNCIIPFLFDEAERRGANLRPAFQLLRDEPDPYIYPAVRHGISFDYRKNEPIEQPVPLPDDVAAGLDTAAPKLLERRKCWNREAPPEAGLPTEWWREVVERRNRYRDIRQKMETGDVAHINDLITLNLDIRLFAQNALHHTDDPAFLRHFFNALQRVSVLDPTCGSGAFLFAALNILEPLYEICLRRMAEFAETQPGKYKDFEKTLADANDTARHPNLEYFIYKKIIVHNLYGVDIMREATEIAKLRLFLKLMSTVEADRRKPNLGLEPLPDVDFNIRSGNSLVGFASLASAEDAINQRDIKPGHTGRLIFGDEIEVIAVVREKADLVARAFTHFQDAQVVTDAGSESHRKAKAELRRRLADLNDALHTYLAYQYGIEREKQKPRYADWLAAHQPFHWFAEFYDIVHNRGGFDCVIGNPPYVELKEVNKSYRVQGFQTLECGNLYALCYEQSINFTSNKGKIGFIIPIASVCTEGYSTLQKLWVGKGDLFISCFNDRPGKLFEGLEHIRLAIVLLNLASKNAKIFSSKYLKWNTVARPELFQSIDLQKVEKIRAGHLIPKLGSELGQMVLKRIESDHLSVAKWLSKTCISKIYFTRKLSGFVQILDFIPVILDEEGNIREPSELKDLCFGKVEYAQVILSLLNSSLFYWYLTVWSDCRNLNQREIQSINFDFDKSSETETNTLVKLSVDLMEDLKRNSQSLKMSFKNAGNLTIQCIYPKYSKPILDEIDTVLAGHYGFTAEELDFIINYDIKYRLGRGGGEE